MKRKPISNLRQFLFAMVLPATAIAAGLLSCEENAPGMPEERPTEKTTSRNPLMRSPQEAIDIAQRAYEEFYGDATPESRSSRGRSVVDCSRPVEIVRGPASRSSGSDTLLYVVNFEDDQGFAVIAATRAVDELLAVTSQGHYYPESDPDAESVPAFDMWMETAREYVASLPPTPVDTATLGGKIDGIDSLLIIKRDTLPLGPGIDPPSINPPIIIIGPKDPGKDDPDDPDDPGLGLLQQREWNETISKFILPPQVQHLWGQGYGNKENISASNCEGYYFYNGVCGCATTALAQVCVTYRYPDWLYKIRPGVGQIYHFDWNEISHHKMWTSNKDYHLAQNPDWRCNESNVTIAHDMVATLCRIIGDYGEASYLDQLNTGMTSEGILKAAIQIFGSKNVSTQWYDMSDKTRIYENEILVVTGKPLGTEGFGHAWVCDGNKHIEYIHYYATSEAPTPENPMQMWRIQSAEKGRSSLHHFNWGWDGNKNGWYVAFQPILKKSNKGYKDLKYIKITKPNR